MIRGDVRSFAERRPHRSWLAAFALSFALPLLMGAGSEQCRMRPNPNAVADVTLVGVADPVGRLEGSLRELLDRLGVALCLGRRPQVSLTEIVERPAAPAPALARVWIVVQPSEVVIYVVDGPWERFLIRKVAATAPLDEVATEQIALIVHTAVEALQQGLAFGVPRQEVHVPAPPDSPPVLLAPPTRVGYQGEVAVRAVGSYRGPGGPLAGLEVAALLMRRASGPRVVGLLAVGYRLPDSSPGDGVELHTSSARLSAGVGWHLPLAGRVALRPAVGAALEVELTEPRAVVDSDIDPADGQARLWPLLTTELALQMRLTRAISLTLSVGAEFDLLGRRFVVDTPSGRAIVAEPWQVVPVGRIGAGWAL